MSESKPRKTRLQFTLASLLILLLLAAAQFAWMAIMYRKLEQARLQAEAERARAEQSLMMARQAAEQLLQLQQQELVPSLTPEQHEKLLESLNKE